MIGQSKTGALTRNRGIRPDSQTIRAMRMVSICATWLSARMQPPDCGGGTLSRSRHFVRKNKLSIGIRSITQNRMNPPALGLCNRDMR